MQTLQGRTGVLQELPRELQEGRWMSLGAKNRVWFMSSLGGNTAVWGFSSSAPESRTAELSAIFADPKKKPGKEFFLHHDHDRL